MTHWPKYPTLKRRKIGDRQYALLDGETVVAEACMTGEAGRDTYPWDILPIEELGRRLGPTATLTEAIDEVSARWHAAKTADDPVAQAKARVAEWVRQYGMQRGMDPETVNSVYADPDTPGPAHLTISDLKTLLEALP